MGFSIVLPRLLGLAWLLPLVSFALIVFWGRRMGRGGRCAGYLATLAIGCSTLLSFAALIGWLWHNPPVPSPASGEWYMLASFGALRLTIGYYIDALTVAMFCMVTLVATCIHVYSLGYMHEELDEMTDPLVTLSDGRPLRRRGRFHRFFQYLSLFCFSMLGLVIAGNLAMVFAFWELVGICSYLLIGFYFERRSASNAANKAFIVNRIGDFGMIIGLMAVWTGMGTFSFDNYHDAHGAAQPGIFSQVRPPCDHLRLPRARRHDGAGRAGGISFCCGRWRNGRVGRGSEPHQLRFGHFLVGLAARPTLQTIDDARRGNLVEPGTCQPRSAACPEPRLLAAGCGRAGHLLRLRGQEAQFPLHVWLPDAMEGPTPVSALIHAATMVAAGVYLVGRCYPLFTPEVLTVIAYTGCITLFIAATIALTATDIKRVLAYSTVSQLGYMMLALGVGGWLAGLFHLFTHACFKALLFLCSGSVIHACGTNEMPQMGGLRKKMPWTAGTMLVGCLAISGAGVPLLIGLSGFYSKDRILAQVLSFANDNPPHRWIFWVAVAGAAMTAFYMFRLWYLTFAGQPRDEHVHQHAHESPWTMVGPLVVLAVLAVFAGGNLLWTNVGLEPLLEQARPAGIAGGASAGWPSPRGGPARRTPQPRARDRASGHVLGLRLRPGRLPLGHGDLRPADDLGRMAPPALPADLQLPHPQVVV